MEVTLKIAEVERDHWIAELATSSYADLQIYGSGSTPAKAIASLLKALLAMGD